MASNFTAQLDLAPAGGHPLLIIVTSAFRFCQCAPLLSIHWAPTPDLKDSQEIRESMYDYGTKHLHSTSSSRHYELHEGLRFPDFDLYGRIPTSSLLQVPRRRLEASPKNPSSLASAACPCHRHLQGGLKAVPTLRGDFWTPSLPP